MPFWWSSLIVIHSLLRLKKGETWQDTSPQPHPVQVLAQASPEIRTWPTSLGQPLSPQEVQNPLRMKVLVLILILAWMGWVTSQLGNLPLLLNFTCPLLLLPRVSPNVHLVLKLN